MQTAIDPCILTIGIMWQKGVGWTLDHSFALKAHSAMWSWPSGILRTTPVISGNYTTQGEIKWEWRNGQVFVEVGTHVTPRTS